MAASAPCLEAEDVGIEIEAVSFRVAMEEMPPPSYEDACKSKTGESGNCALLQQVSGNQNNSGNASSPINRKQLFELLCSSYETDISKLKSLRSLPAFNAQEPQIRAHYCQEFQRALENLPGDKSANAEAFKKFEEKLNDLRNIAVLQVSQLEKVDAAVAIATRHFKRKLDAKMTLWRYQMKGRNGGVHPYFNFGDFTVACEKALERAVLVGTKDFGSEEEVKELACRQAIVEALTQHMIDYERELKTAVLRLL